MLIIIWVNVRRDLKSERHSQESSIILKKMKNKKMANAAFLICCTLTLHIGGLEAAAVNVINCEKDHECPRGTFCYEQGSTCTSCINCLTYNRKDQKNRSCHKEPKDCGDCLSGFKEEYYVEGHRSNTCKKDDSSLNDFNWINIVIGILVLLLFSVTCALVVFCRRRINKGQHQGPASSSSSPSHRSMESMNSSNHNARGNEDVLIEHGEKLSSRQFVYETPHSYYTPASAPPLYESEPFLPSITRGGEHNRPVVPVETSETIELHVWNKKESSNMQKATVFRKCKYDSSSASENQPDEGEIQEDVPDEVDSHEDSDPVQQDEETLESTWTPHQNSGVATEANSEVPDQNEDDNRPTSGSTETISPGDFGTGGHINDSGLSSSTSLHRHFACFGNSSDGTTILDEATGITRSVSDEAVTPAKRQRRDSGTHSLGQASTSDTQFSDSDIHN